MPHCRIVIARGHGAHPREAENHPRRDTPVGTARQHDVQIPRPQQRGGIPDRVGRTGTPGGHHMTDAPEAERDGQLARQHADDANGDGVGRDVLAALREEVLVLRFAHIDAAAAAADQNAGVGLADLQAGIVPGFTRRNHAQQGRARVPPGIRPRLPRAGSFSAERLRVGDGHRRHWRGHAAGDVGDVELGNGARAAHTPADVIPKALTADAKARRDADAGDHDARRSWGHVPIIPVAWGPSRPWSRRTGNSMAGRRAVRRVARVLRLELRRPVRSQRAV